MPVFIQRGCFETLRIQEFQAVALMRSVQSNSMIATNNQSWISNIITGAYKMKPQIILHLTRKKNRTWNSNSLAYE